MQKSCLKLMLAVLSVLPKLCSGFTKKSNLDCTIIQSFLTKIRGVKVLFSKMEKQYVLERLK